MNAELRVLFLLKEAYDLQPQEKDWESWTLPQLVRENGSTIGITWRRLGQWAWVFHRYRDTSVLPFWSPPVNPDQYLQQIAVVNIKKSGGTRTSNRDDLFSVMSKDGHRVFEQIRTLAPDVVVCGNTLEFLIASEEWKADASFDMAVFTMDGIVYFDHWHPANRYPDAMNYYYLQSLVRGAGGSALWNRRDGTL